LAANNPPRGRGRIKEASRKGNHCGPVKKKRKIGEVSSQKTKHVKSKQVGAYKAEKKRRMVVIRKWSSRPS